MTAGGEGWIPPGLVVTLMKAYGIETPRIGLAPNVRQARAMARTVGYPVALKLALPGLTHRTEVGGVMLNIDTPETLEQAFADLIDRSRDFVSDPEQVEGVYVQQMVRGVTEVIIGAVHDPQFGLLVMVGGGGTQVELLGDVTFELAPLNRKQVEAMLDRTTVGRLLAGFRGSPPGDREIVIKVILLLAQIAREWPQVAEIEINPLIVMPQGKGASAVDVRLRVEAISNGRS
jgi:acetyltransferase